MQGLDVGGEGDTLTDPTLLMEILEIREAIEACTPGAPDATATLHTLLTANEQSRATLLTQLSGAFKTRALDNAKALTIRLIYLTNIRDEIARRLPPK